MSTEASGKVVSLKAEEMKFFLTSAVHGCTTQGAEYAS